MFYISNPNKEEIHNLAGCIRPYILGEDAGIAAFAFHQAQLLRVPERDDAFGKPEALRLIGEKEMDLATQRSVCELFMVLRSQLEASLEIFKQTEGDPRMQNELLGVFNLARNEYGGLIVLR